VPSQTAIFTQRFVRGYLHLAFGFVA
jgi:hypothetical protein